MAASGENITVDEAITLVGDGAEVLDVRELEEFDAGRVAGALHVPLMDLPDRLDEVPHRKVVICVCRVGTRSARAAAFLAAQGFDSRNLVGGMVAWVGAGQDIVGDSAEPAII
jgi:rhodanese-related sulfurtransferase